MMVKNLILFFVILLVSCSPKGNRKWAQDSPCLKYYDKSLKMVVYTDLSERAAYPGGTVEGVTLALRKFVYPKQDELQLKANICFIIDEMGELKDVRVYKKELSDYSKFDIEVIKVLRQMKNWKAGECNGKKVASLLLMPIHIDVSE